MKIFDYENGEYTKNYDQVIDISDGEPYTMGEPYKCKVDGVWSVNLTNNGNGNIRIRAVKDVEEKYEGLKDW